jgi:hypothetical protein
MSNINQVNENNIDVNVEQLYPNNFLFGENVSVIIPSDADFYGSILNYFTVPIYLEITNYTCLDDAIYNFDTWLKKELSENDCEFDECLLHGNRYGLFVLQSLFHRSWGTPKYLNSLVWLRYNRIDPDEMSTYDPLLRALYIDYLNVLENRPGKNSVEFLFTLYRDYHHDKITEAYMENVNVKPCKM